MRLFDCQSNNDVSMSVKDCFILILTIFLEVTRPKNRSKCESHKFKVEENAVYDSFTAITKKSAFTDCI